MANNAGTPDIFEKDEQTGRRTLGGTAFTGHGAFGWEIGFSVESDKGLVFVPTDGLTDADRAKAIRKVEKDEKKGAENG